MPTGVGAVTDTAGGMGTDDKGGKGAGMLPKGVREMPPGAGGGIGVVTISA